MGTDERAPADGGDVTLEVTLDSLEYRVNAMPPGPPVPPVMRVRVALAGPGRVVLQGGPRFVLAVRSEDGAEMMSLPVGPEEPRGRVLVLDEPLVEEAAVVLAGEEGPLPDGRYVVEAAAAALPPLVARTRCEVTTVH